MQDELNVKTVKLAKGKELAISLDTKLTPELIQEGTARELIRKINDYRKELKLIIKDKIKLSIHTNDKEVLQTIKKFENVIKTSVHAEKIVITSTKQAKEFKIREVGCTISITKV
nr:hypothetical protein [uncultured archaeon]